MSEIICSKEEGRRGLSLNALKYIAVVAMLIDHSAVALVDPALPLYSLMRCIGRITGPVMFFAAAEGYHHTRDVKKYLGRLFLFALISYAPFLYFDSAGQLSNVNFLYMNVIFTIFLGVLAIHIRRTVKNPVLRVFLIVVCVALSSPADWGIIGVILILIFDYYYGYRRFQLFGYFIWVLFDRGLLRLLGEVSGFIFYGNQLPYDKEFLLWEVVEWAAVLPLILLCFYKGEKGRKTAFSKWFFYVIYPLHLAILGYITSQS